MKMEISLKDVKAEGGAMTRGGKKSLKCQSVYCAAKWLQGTHFENAATTLTWRYTDYTEGCGSSCTG